jgi:hypothetical protein
MDATHASPQFKPINRVRQMRKEKVKQVLKEIFTIKFLRILVFLLFTAVLFYIVYPKYQLIRCERINKITGTVEHFNGGKWHSR